MSNKLSGNVLWESSRMMLPEHKEAINRYNRVQQQKQRRTELDEQEQVLINHALQQSMRHRITLSIHMYDPYEELNIVGTVERIDKQLQRFMVDGEWFSLRQIKSLEMDNYQ